MEPKSDIAPMDLLIIGGGTRAKEVMHVVMREGRDRPLGCVHDLAEPGEMLPGSPALGRVEDLRAIMERTGAARAIIAINDLGQRMAMAQRVQAMAPGLVFASAVDPAALVSRGIAIGAGSVVLAGARIGPDVTIGEHVFIGSGATIGADAVLGSFTSVNAGAAVGEGCHVGSGSAIGMNAALMERVIVGTHCVVAPGAMVLASVPDLHVAEGSPARCTRTRLVGERHH